MIREIKIRNVASYDNAGVTLENLTKVNFIFGGNGSGKTTLSNFLANPSEEKYKDCQCEWENADHERIIVYNRKFRETNIANKTNIQGVFTLGQSSAELEKEIKNCKETLDRLSQNKSACVKQLHEKEVELEKGHYNMMMQINEI